jgi:hypothetical protein
MVSDCVNPPDPSVFAILREQTILVLAGTDVQTDPVHLAVVEQRSVLNATFREKNGTTLVTQEFRASTQGYIHRTRNVAPGGTEVVFGFDDVFVLPVRMDVVLCVCVCVVCVCVLCVCIMSTFCVLRCSCLLVREPE